MQNYVNLLYREEEREMLPLCEAEGVGVIPWSPLARGRLTRDWDETTTRSETDQFGKTIFSKTAEADRKVVEVVAEVARERGVPRAQVALAWVLAKPEVSAPIVGASKPAHLDDAIAALGIALSDTEIERLEAPYVPHAVVGFS
jgi:1-deoxyxylulose-5-phosphate synthase